MKTRTLLGLCVIAFAACACSDGTAPDAANDSFGTQQSALKTRNLGELGGSPWSAEGSITSWTSPSGIANGQFGSAMVTGNFRNYAEDLLVAQSALMTKGRIYGRYHSGNANGFNDSVFEITRTGTETDAFGYAMVTGNFCEGSYVSKRKGDILIASMPNAGENLEGGISIWGWNKSWKLIREMKSANPFELAGTALAVGDLDGDGKTDLVYASTPLDENWNYLPGKVSVVLDFCSKYGHLAADMTLQANTEDTNFGASLYVEDLDGTGTPEIIVLDNLGGEHTDRAAAGSLHFYKVIDNTLVESRPALIGDAGASMESVAFSDIDGDGDLDLIVGQPMFQTTKKREGRVRTYTNAGPGAAFDPEIMAWSATSERSNAMFGSEVVVSDLNHDGVDDVMIGAPGMRATSGSADRAMGYVYVYMGTKDGSIFSKTPYWTYMSDVSTTINDDFGRNILPLQIDATGWDDLIVAAPKASTSTSQIDNLGRVDIFTAGNGICYRADQCQIDGICYEAGASADDLCAYCDPQVDNFGFTAVVCEATDNPCIVNTCQPDSGTCAATPLEEGAACGETTCDGNTLTAYQCISGICTAEDTDCGAYRCSEAGTLACMMSCTSNADCYKGSCENNVCVIPENGIPLIILEDYPSQVTVGTELLLDASASYDADGGDIWISWWSSDVTWDLVDSTSTDRIALTAPEDPGFFSVHIQVIDDEGLSAAKDIVIEAVEAPEVSKSNLMRVHSPAAGATLDMGSALDVVGNAEPQSDVNVILRAHDGSEIAASCETIADEAGQWSCTLIDGATTIPAGDYVITALTQVNGIPVSYDVNVHLSEPLSTDENGNLQGGACAISPVSTSNGWWILLAGMGLALLPLRRKTHASIS